MALPSIKNSVGMAVSAVADSGVGTITLGAALSGGYQTAATAYGANANIDIRIEEGNTWEVCRDCTYTHSGTTVTRGTQEEGSSGTSTRVAFTTAAKVYVIEPAARIERAVRNALSITPGGRLTLESGVPVSTTDQTAKTTIYYTPYVHNVITLWDGSDWVPTMFTQKDVGTLSGLTTGRPYDVFGYLSAGELALETAIWSSATARTAFDISLQDGRYCKTGDKTKLYLGTFAAASATTTEDSEANRLVFNAYNREDRNAIYDSGDTGHTWTGTAGYRQYNNSSAAKIQYVNGLLGLGSFCITQSGINKTSLGTTPAQTWIGINSTSTPTTGTVQTGTVGTLDTSVAATSSLVSPVLGINSINLLERNIDAAQTMTYSYGRMRGTVKC